MKRVRHEEHCGTVQRRRIVAQFGAELVDRVENERLDAVPCVEIRLGNPLVEILDRGLSASIAVAVRIVDQFTVSEQRVIDAPRVDGKTRQSGRVRNGFLQSGFELAEQGAEIPEIMPVLLARIVFEPVYFLKFEFPVLCVVNNIANIVIC